MDIVLLKLGLLFLSIELWFAKAQVGFTTGDMCASKGDCNGHGRCNSATKVCTCFEGFGAPTDISLYKAPDCSLRTCPAGLSWSSIPTGINEGHTLLAECSDGGTCIRTTGKCSCYPQFEGSACQRMKCPNACSGHGRCLSIRELATKSNALPLSPIAAYSGAETSTTWDENRIFGCLCDSSWAVGLGAGESQVGEYFGADCSLVRCPSGDDPMTAVDETDCSGITAAGGYGIGAAGNLCHTDCANRGICDYKTGKCKCFSGYYGSNCASLSPIS